MSESNKNKKQIKKERPANVKSGQNERLEDLRLAFATRKTGCR